MLIAAAFVLFKIADLPVTHIMSATQLSTLQNSLAALAIIVTIAIYMYSPRDK